MRVLCTVMVWGRWDVFNVWAENTKTLPVDVLVVGSEGDVSREAAERHGFMYREFPNEPLGAKAQARLDFTRDMEWDYLLFLGSDDLMSRSALDFSLAKMEEGYDLIAPKDVYYWVDGKAWYSPGYGKLHAPHRNHEALPFGRCVSRAGMELLRYDLWPPVKKFIDGPAWARLRAIENACIYRHSEEGTMTLILKTTETETPWKIRRHYEAVAPSKIDGFYPPHVLNLIR